MNYAVALWQQCGLCTVVLHDCHVPLDSALHYVSVKEEEQTRRES
jgi:hypothetical protein